MKGHLSKQGRARLVNTQSIPLQPNFASPKLNLVNSVQYSTVQYSTLQYSKYSTVQYSTVHCSTVLYSTVQYSTVCVQDIDRLGLAATLSEALSRVDPQGERNIHLR